MKNEKTKIDIKDNKKFCDVAFLIDRDDYQKDIEKIRQKYKIKMIFKGSLDKWQQENKENSIFHKFQLDVEELRKKYGFPRLMDRAIIASILCDRISDKDYDLVKIEFIENLSPEFLIKNIQPRLLIEITPFTRLKDIKIEFEKRKQYLDDYLLFYRALNFRFDMKIVNEVERNRKWYWIKKKNKEIKYKEIAIKELGKDKKYYKEALESLNGRVINEEKELNYHNFLEIVDKLEDKIKHAVENYEKILTTDLIISSDKAYLLTYKNSVS